MLCWWGCVISCTAETMKYDPVSPEGCFYVFKAYQTLKQSTVVCNNDERQEFISLESYLRRKCFMCSCDNLQVNRNSAFKLQINPPGICTYLQVTGQRNALSNEVKCCRKDLNQMQLFLLHSDASFGPQQCHSLMHQAFSPFFMQNQSLCESRQTLQV